MTGRTRWTILAPALLLLPLTACGVSGEATTAVEEAAQAQANPALSTTDAGFIDMAAAAGLAEVEFGKLASRRGAAISVRQFGQQMVVDHTKLNAELAQLARSKGISPSRSLDTASEGAYNSLNTLHGRAFDRAYILEQVTAHRDQLALFQGASQKANDPEVRALAARYVGMIQHHLVEVERLHRIVPRHYRAELQT